MTKHAKKTTASKRPTRRLQVIGVLAVVIVCAIAATAISMQASKGESNKTIPGGRTSGNNPTSLRSTQNGQNVTQAQIRPLTQAEAQQMAEGLKELLNQSTDDLKQVRHADGSVSMDLQGRLQNVALAKKAADGTVTQSCVDNPEAAAAFLGIDRELIDGIKSSPKTRQPGQLEADITRGGQN